MESACFTPTGCPRGLKPKGLFTAPPASGAVVWNSPGMKKADEFNSSLQVTCSLANMNLLHPPNHQIHGLKIPSDQLYHLNRPEAGCSGSLIHSEQRVSQEQVGFKGQERGQEIVDRMEEQMHTSKRPIPPARYSGALAGTGSWTTCTSEFHVGRA